MKKEFLKFSILILTFFVFSLAVSPLFAEQKPTPEGTKRCEKFYRGPDGKIIRETVPCPSSK